MRTSLYRHFDAKGRLLYVGVSLSAVARLASHKGARWFEDIATVKIEWHPSRAHAEYAERFAILNEHPLYNRTFKRPREIRRAIDRAIRGFKEMLSELSEPEAAHVESLICNMLGLHGPLTDRDTFYRWDAERPPAQYGGPRPLYLLSGEFD